MLYVYGYRLNNITVELLVENLSSPHCPEKVRCLWHDIFHCFSP